MKNPLDTPCVNGGFTAIFRTLGCIGDSLASGEHESFDGEKIDYHDYYEYSWGQFIARRCGLTAYNFSCGGLTAKEFRQYKGYNKSFVPEKACQAYIIALGRNDMKYWDNYEYGFGSIDDVDFERPDNNRDSFVGHYVKIIQEIRILQPKARIFVVTMPVSDTDRGEKDEKADMHAEFLRSLPNYFEFLYVLDLRKYAPVHDGKFRESYYCGGHLSAMGYLLTAEQMMTLIDDIIKNNPKDFTQVGFIGKSVHNIREKW
ncbi:MAG: SGNH/GDSL hydrolase family protein [Clostridia bacterium]|nr:SGNH/GDSL hydrolase family protein [Clostridia bacterium]